VRQLMQHTNAVGRSSKSRLLLQALLQQHLAATQLTIQTLQSQGVTARHSSSHLEFAIASAATGANAATDDNVAPATVHHHGNGFSSI
jgi:hypothetical protein